MRIKIGTTNITIDGKKIELLEESCNAMRKLCPKYIYLLIQRIYINGNV